jgi:transposase
MLHVDVKQLGNIPYGGGWRYVGRQQGHKNRQLTPGKPKNAQRNPKMGHAYVHTVLDDHSRVAYAEIHNDETAVTAVAVLRRAVAWFAARGVKVERVLSDNGSCYKSKLWKKTCAELGIKAKKTAPTGLRPTGGLTLALPDVLGTKVGRMVATEFADPARLAALGSSRFIRFGATRGLQIRRLTADKVVAAARDALPMPDAAVARAVLAADLTLLADLDHQIDAATGQLTRLVPLSPLVPLLTVPGWGPVRAGNYGGALGDPTRFTSSRQVYRTAGLNPIQYESAGKRRDSVISREGSVELRRALIDLGLGLWLV